MHMVCQSSRLPDPKVVATVAPETRGLRLQIKVVESGRAPHPSRPSFSLFHNKMKINFEGYSQYPYEAEGLSSNYRTWFRRPTCRLTARCGVRHGRPLEAKEFPYSCPSFLENISHFVPTQKLRQEQPRPISWKTETKIKNN